MQIIKGLPDLDSDTIGLTFSLVIIILTQLIAIMSFLLLILIIIHPTIIKKVNGYYPQLSPQEAREFLRTQNFDRIRISERTLTRFTHHQPHRVFETSIIFPTDDSFPSFFNSNTNSNSNSKTQIKEGSNCFLPDGNMGTCKGLKSCEAFDSDSSSTTLFRPASIKWCDEDDSKSWLICCPKSSKPEGIVPAITPEAETPKVEAAEMEIPKASSDSELSPARPPQAEKVIDSSPPLISSVEKPQVPQPSALETKIQGPVNSNSESDANDADMQKTCGILPSKSQALEQYGTNWPWIVSIGRRNSDGDIDWICLGSLITKDYILTIATCLQKLPNVILIGNKPFIGHMKAGIAKSSQYSNDIRTVSQVISHEKFMSPYIYRNIGLLQTAVPIHVTPTLMPICFPFLAGVLDIMDFKGREAVTLGFNFPVKIDSKDSGLEFQAISYKVLNNSECNRLYNLQKSKTSYRLPNGIRPDNMCGLYKTQTSICQAPGAPLVILDNASNSLVVIGISSGDPTCSELKRQLVSFTRVNAFSSWVREQIAEFPQPPPCYI